MARYDTFDWSGSDRDAILADLKARARAVFPQWTDIDSLSNPGAVILDLFSILGDRMRYYQDRQALENFPVTATERDNVIRAMALIDYVLSTAASATVAITLTPDKAYSSPIVIPQGDAVFDESQTVRFELTDRVEWPAGDATPKTVVVIEGLTVFEQSIGLGDGQTPGLSFALAQSPFLAGSETIEVDGVVWTRVDDFLSSKATDQVYTVKVSDSSTSVDVARILFGDGVTGAIPDGIVAASYRVTLSGGEAGNVEAETLTRLGQTYATASGVPVRITVSQPVKASGGADRETTDHARVYGPRSLAAGNRSVASLDYQTNAESVSGIARAYARTSNEDPTIPEETVYVAIVPTGGGQATTTLKDAVRTQLSITKPKVNCVRVMVTQAPYVLVAPVGTVYLRHAESGQPLSASVVQAAGASLLTTLTTWFDPSNIDPFTGDFTALFGGRVALSNLYRLLETGASGVAWADLTDPTDDLVLAANYFPALRAATAVVGTYSATGPAGTVTLPMISYQWTGLLSSQALVVREAPF